MKKIKIIIGIILTMGVIFFSLVVVFVLDFDNKIPSLPKWLENIPSDISLNHPAKEPPVFHTDTKSHSNRNTLEIGNELIDATLEVDQPEIADMKFETGNDVTKEVMNDLPIVATTSNGLGVDVHDELQESSSITDDTDTDIDKISNRGPYTYRADSGRTGFYSEGLGKHEEGKEYTDVVIAEILDKQQRSRLLFLDAATGKKLSVKTIAQNDDSFVLLSLADGYGYFWDRQLNKKKNSLFCLDMKSDKVIWETGKVWWNRHHWISEYPQSVSIVDNVLFVNMIVSTNDDKLSEKWGVTLLNPKTGERRAVYEFQKDEISTGSPTVYNGIIYVMGDRNPLTNPTRSFLYAIQAGTGKVFWTVQFSHSYFGLCISPAISDNTVYVTADKHLYAIDATTGKERWKVTAEVGIYDTPAAGHGIVAVFARVGPKWNSELSKIYAFDTMSGNVLWCRDAGLIWYIYQSPVISGNTVYAASQDEVFSFHAISGQELWRTANETGTKYPLAVTDSRVFVSSRSKIYALNGKTGEELWKFEMDSKDGNFGFIFVTN